MKSFIRIPIGAVVLAACILGFMLAMYASTANAQESPALAQEIQKRAAAIGPNDAAGHQSLADFLYNHKLYHQALAQVNDALAIRPDFQNAQLLKNLILSELRQKATPTPTSTPPARKSATVANVPISAPPTAAGRKLLTMKDVYKIRFWQLSRHETTPIEGKILNRRKTLESFWHKAILLNPIYQNSTLTRRDYEQFISPSNLQRQIYLFRRLGTKKYWDKVQISSDPAVMKIFRTDIQPIALQSCGTIGCHRGQNAPGFRLFGNEGGSNTIKTYTNFLTLTRFKYKNRSLISLRNPRMSLLLQYLRPKELRAYNHPGKIGPQPVALNQNLILNWIESLRYPPHSYGISKPATTRAAKK